MLQQVIASYTQANNFLSWAVFFSGPLGGETP